MHRNCCGSLRPNARRSGEVNGEDRHVQIGVGDRGLFLFVRRRSLYVLDSIRGVKMQVLENWQFINMLA